MLKNSITLIIALALSVPLKVYTQSINNYAHDKVGRLTHDHSEGIITIKWNSTNKITEIIRTDTSHAPDLEFRYDVLGNRILKIEKPRNGNGLEPEYHWKYTHYENDPYGNILATYKIRYEQKSSNRFTEQITKTEQNLISQDRFGQYRGSDTIPLITRTFTANISSAGRFQNIQEEGMLVSPFNMNLACERGQKTYELNDYLKNTKVTVYDRIKPSSEAIEPLQTEVFTIADHYPFGMTIQDRSMSAHTYRYGYGHKENDLEIKGPNNSYDFGARIYDPRLGRWASIDPQFSDYPAHTPYHYALNSPIMLTDPNGESVVDSHGNKITFKLTKNDNQKWSLEFKFDSDVSQTQQNKFKNSKTASAFRRIAQLGREGRDLLRTLNKTERKIMVTFAKDDEYMIHQEWEKHDRQTMIQVDETFIQNRVYAWKKKLEKYDRLESLLRNGRMNQEQYEKISEQSEVLREELDMDHFPPFFDFSIDEHRQLLAIPVKDLTTIMLAAAISVWSDSKKSDEYLHIGESLDKKGHKFAKIMAESEVFRNIRIKARFYYNEYQKQQAKSDKN